MSYIPCCCPVCGYKFDPVQDLNFCPKPHFPLEPDCFGPNELIYEDDNPNLDMDW